MSNKKKSRKGFASDAVVYRVSAVAGKHRVRCVECNAVIPEGQPFERFGTRDPDSGGVEYWVNVCLASVNKVLGRA